MFKEPSGLVLVGILYCTVLCTKSMVMVVVGGGGGVSLSVTSQLTTGSHVCVFDRNTMEGFTGKCNKLSLTGKCQ